MANDTTEPNAKRARVSNTDYDDDDDVVDDSESESEMEDGEERLSDFPDCTDSHIDIPHNHRCDFKFRQMTRFNDAVSKFLLLRDGSVPLLNVDLHHFSSMCPDIQTSISEYAVMHNVERLKLHAERFKHLSPSVFSSQTLTSLHLSARGHGLIPKSLSMGALTSLHLKNFHFCAADNENETLDPFSSCVKLKTLVIEHCSIKH
ncbi:hypothetical protein PIB30_020229 [Stylosanthes scabra]|uniref:Uncharacterized protein n=1 Tax=Stylosanthes scabra TaxID=79078 RepID=A0ABU6S8T3_9FABA|nr:hypothetical protein [Stylosanthes scabra]